MNYIIGAVGGGIFLFAYSRLSRAMLVDAAYTAFAIMVAIYVGAHLVTSDLGRILYEAIGATMVLGVAMFFREKWPLGLGILILGHGAYDFLLGHSSAVADWYPPMCVGFDIVVGLGLIGLILKKRGDGLRFRA